MVQNSQNEWKYPQQSVFLTLLLHPGNGCRSKATNEVLLALERRDFVIASAQGRIVPVREDREELVGAVAIASTVS
jgi:hypothetical protein